MTHQKNKPTITVVTVVFNGEQFIEKTILSVINQTYSNVEYIIIDGGSTDGTLEIVHKYESAIDYWVSEKDLGIYYAMNKGIARATGQWINFMNAGDWFFTDDVIFSVFENKNYSKALIIYGNHEVRYHSGRRRIDKAGQVMNLWKGSQFCHQAVFVNTKYHRLNNFNANNKIIADFEFFYRAWKNNAKFQYIPLVICSFEAGGLSDTKRIDSILGWWSIVDKNMPINIAYIFLLIKEVVKMTIKNFISFK